MEKWSVANLDFSVDDFTMECSCDLLTALTYKTGHVQVHLFKLSDGKPHPRARRPLLKYDIPLNPTENGWQIEAVICENRLGCLFTSIANHQESVDHLVVWDWTTGDLVKVFSQYGNLSFIFLDDNTIVAGSVEDSRPALAFFNLASDEKPVTGAGRGHGLTRHMPVSWHIRLNLGIPIRHGPELRVRVPFVVSPSEQTLFLIVFVMGFGTATLTHSVALPLSKLRSWAQEDMSLVRLEDWEESAVRTFTRDPRRASFTMGSRFAIFNDVTPTVAGPDFADASDIITPVVCDLNPHHLMRVVWDASSPHCQGVPGLWNTVAPVCENGSHPHRTRNLVESATDLYLTEDSLVILQMGTEPKLKVLSF